MEDKNPHCAKTQAKEVADEQGSKLHEVKGGYPEHVHHAKIFLEQTPKIKLLTARASNFHTCSVGG